MYLPSETKFIMSSLAVQLMYVESLINIHLVGGGGGVGLQRAGDQVKKGAYAKEGGTLFIRHWSLRLYLQEVDTKFIINT